MQGTVFGYPRQKQLEWLTHRQEVPRDSRRGKTGEHMVGAGEVGEVGKGH